MGVGAGVVSGTQAKGFFFFCFFAAAFLTREEEAVVAVAEGADLRFGGILEKKRNEKRTGERKCENSRFGHFPQKSPAHFPGKALGIVSRAFFDS